MKYKYVIWEIVPGLVVPMMEDESGMLWGTNKTVANMLGMDESSIRHIYERNSNEFDANCVSDCHALDFLKENKELFGAKYIRKDMKLWSSQDMLTFCYKATGAKSIEIRKKLTQFIIENSKKAYVPLEIHQEVERNLEKAKNQNQSLIDFIMATMPGIEDIASFAGKTLAVHKKTKEFRSQFSH